MQYGGESCVNTLSDDTEVYAPSAVSKRLNLIGKDTLPVYIRPKGKKKSKKKKKKKKKTMNTGTST